MVFRAEPLSYRWRAYNEVHHVNRGTRPWRGDGGSAGPHGAARGTVHGEAAQRAWGRALAAARRLPRQAQRRARQAPAGAPPAAHREAPSRGTLHLIHSHLVHFALSSQFDQFELLLSSQFRNRRLSISKYIYKIRSKQYNVCINNACRDDFNKR